MQNKQEETRSLLLNNQQKNNKTIHEPWWKTAVFYQIYPRSFMDSNEDGVGDLQGIISKLDYFSELGITALWISPFFQSPMVDFGYDISDHMNVDPLFGTLDDALTLIKEAHAHKIKLIFDLVINHTSDQHPWFLEARSSRTNPKHDWFIWENRTDAKTGKKLPKPNNWVSQFEFKSAWWNNEETDEWYLGTFTRHQPEVNWRNPELRKEMYTIVRFWLDKGIDGFRIDVVNWFIKDKKLRSNPFSFNANPDIFQQHIYDRNQPEVHEICKEIRSIADSYLGERVLVGEVFVQNAKIAASYLGASNDELHLSFNFELLYLKWNAISFKKALERWYSVLPETGRPTLTLSNHDQKRHGSRLGTRDHYFQKKRMEIAAMLLLTARGTPFIYYGEEIGMINTRIPKKELVDPTGITFWPLPLGRDGERTPMQWNTQENAGFSKPGVRPWLRIHKNYPHINIETQKNDSNSLWNWYKKLLFIRNKYTILQTGNFRFLFQKNKSLIAFRRSHTNEESKNRSTGSIDCYLNFSRSSMTISLDSDARVLLGNYRNDKEILRSGQLVLAPHEALLVSF